MTERDPGLVLVTGATGYVGGQLVPRLLESGIRVRILTRNPARLSDSIRDKVEVAVGDVTDPDSLRRACDGVSTAYYMVHSLDAGGDFESQEVASARNFGDAAATAGVGRIVYLGALGHETPGSDKQSRHMKSRNAVGDALRDSGVQIVELRSPMILGAGSLPFEMIRSLVERLPVMLIPRWVRWPTQPISARDAMEYLAQSATIDVDGNAVVEIGGDDVASFGEVMAAYARQRGLRRLTVSVPVISPRLSSLWLLVFTPARFQAGRRLVDSASGDTVVRDDSARSLFAIEPMGLREAIASALDSEDRWFDETPDWSQITGGRTRTPWGGMRRGGRIIESRTVRVDAPADRVFAAVANMGGRSGYGATGALWRLRGWIDRLFGGPGMVPDERNGEQAEVGDRFDMWRVERIDPGHTVVYSAIARLPGRAWLRFDVERDGDGSLLRQTAMFDARGLFGRFYWYALYPFHSLIFRSMLRRVGREVN